MVFISVVSIVGIILVFLGLGQLGGGEKKLSRMNYMVLHLCIADLSVVLFNLVPQIAWKITFYFEGGSILCKIVSYVQVSIMVVGGFGAMVVVVVSVSVMVVGVMVVGWLGQ